MPTPSTHPRTRLVVLALVLLVSAGLSGVASRWFLSRELVFEASFSSAPTPWNLEWIPASEAILPPRPRLRV